MVADRQQKAQVQGILSRGGPALAVIGIHVILIYVISASMGIVPVPTFKPPLVADLIPENKPEQKPEPVIEPDIKPQQITQDLRQDMPLVPPIDEEVPVAQVDSITAAIIDKPPVEQGAVAQELKAKQRVEPLYPAGSRRDGEEGTVRLRVLVDERGRPSEVQLAQGSGFARLDDAAMDAVRRWRFQAATNGSNAISAWTQVNISFKLTEKDRR
jgi:protein TonB